jgi:hypothetical protein
MYVFVQHVEKDERKGYQMMRVLDVRLAEAETLRAQVRDREMEARFLQARASVRRVNDHQHIRIEQRAAEAWSRLDQARAALDECESRLR